MNSSSDLADDSCELLVSQATDEYLERVDRGEQPDVEEYAQRYPRVADALRGILPALRAMQGESAIHRNGVAMADAAPIGGCLGDYQIVREIGRGGMGIVYEAEQISLRRRVALKVLPFASGLDPRRFNRFQNEAQAAARLHHANIVPIYAVGSERGVCYYAMQMIDGLSLAEVVGQLAQRMSHVATNTSPASLPSDVRSQVLSDILTKADETGLGQKRAMQPEVESPPTAVAALSTVTTGSGAEYYKTIARLAEQAASALQHAHDMGVIHRDVKPANLLIDVHGNLWITDFGLARQHNENDLTMTGDVLGTYRYMSPEQTLGRRGVVDHRTDIYSLGVTLYELLTCRPAFDAEDRQELLQQVTTRDPIPPRRLNRTVPNDLEIIVLKTLEKDPKDRYHTARELADDLRRFLDDRPIRAKRPSIVERAGKWSRRHKPMVASSLVALLLCLVGLAISNVLIARERSKTRIAYQEVSEKQRATAWALAQQEKQRKLAEANFRQAREMLDFVVQASVDDLATDDGEEDLRSRLLQASLEYYQGFIEQSHDDPPLQAQLAASHARVAKILDVIGSTPEARAALERALETQERLVRERPYDPNLRRGLFAMYYQLRVTKGGFPLMLADKESIQQHLGLSADQIAGIAKIHEEHERIHREFSMSSSLDLPKMREEFRNSIDRSQAALAELLSHEQLERLEQIALQKKGVWALDDPEVATQIGLSATQRSLIWKTLQESWERRRYNPWGPRVSLDDQVRELLTPEQQATWEQMLGEPFEDPQPPPQFFRKPFPKSPRRTKDADPQPLA